VPQRSLTPYVRLLEDLYLVNRVPAWGRNLTKRVVGRPKERVADSGLACHLVGVTEAMLADVLQRAPYGGLVESFVASELKKQRHWGCHLRPIPTGRIGSLAS